MGIKLENYLIVIIGASNDLLRSLNRKNAKTILLSELFKSFKHLTIINSKTLKNKTNLGA